MKFARALLTASLLGLALASPGCRYAADRGRDLTDVFDLRYGNGMGLGIQLDATMFLGTGLGYSDGTWTRTWYGRHRVDTELAQFFGWIVASELNATTALHDSADGWNQVLFFNAAILGPADWVGGPAWYSGESRTVPGLETLRFGATLFLPGVHGGLYLNLGELADLLGGLVTFDLADDDGVPKGAPPETIPMAPVRPRG
jgi:hypothetical protein